MDTTSERCELMQKKAYARYILKIYSHDDVEVCVREVRRLLFAVSSRVHGFKYCTKVGTMCSRITQRCKRILCRGKIPLNKPISEAREDGLAALIK
jgi:hypothetical protein